MQQQDLTKEGGVVELVAPSTAPATQKTPKDGDLVTIHFVAKLNNENGQEIHNTNTRNEEFKFVIGEKQVIEGVEIAVKNMIIGEKSKFVIQPKYGYGNTIPLLHPNLPQNSTLFYEIELLDISKDKLFKNDWELSEAEKLTSASNLKDEGNLYFKENDFDKAKSKYSIALRLLGELIDAPSSTSTTSTPSSSSSSSTPASSSSSESPAAEKKPVADLKLLCLLNTAACNLKLKEYKEAVDHCTQALSIDANNLKAYFRRGQAYFSLSDFEKSKQDFEGCLRCCDKNDEKMVKSIQQELAKVQKEQQQYNSKLKKMYSGMFAT